MAIVFMDNFEIYDVVKPVADTMNLQWLLRQYNGVNNGEGGYVLAMSDATVPYQRPVLRTSATGTGSVRRWLSYAAGRHLSDTGGRLSFGCKIVDYPEGARSPTHAILGIGQRVGDEDNIILSIGFPSREQVVVTYSELEGASRSVRQRVLNLDSPLSGEFDTVEWSLQKNTTSPGTYSEFVLWINNRTILVDNIFCNVGDYGSVQAIVHGNFAVPAAGSTGGSIDQGYITNQGTVAAIEYGVTDMYITNGEGSRHTGRLGKVRVTNRMAVYDAEPNDFLKSSGATAEFALNAEVVAQIPPDSTKFLLSPGSGSTDVYGALAFPGLSNEQVMAVMNKALVLKNDPSGSDVSFLTRVGGNNRISPVLGVATRPTYVNYVMSVNPSTGLPWSALEANNSQFGLVTD